jgi:hypothetical protein
VTSHIFIGAVHGPKASPKPNKKEKEYRVTQIKKIQYEPAHLMNTVVKFALYKK